MGTTTSKGSRTDQPLVWAADSNSPTPSKELIDQAIDWMVVERKVDGLIADDDEWAVRLIQRRQKRGFQVPEDVSVIGYDNLRVASLVSPTLTTIDHNHSCYAKAMIDLVISLANGKQLSDSERIRTIQPSLIIREST